MIPQHNDTGQVRLRWLRTIFRQASLIIILCLLSGSAVSQTLSTNEPFDPGVEKEHDLSRRMISYETVFVVLDEDRKIDLGLFNENIALSNGASNDLSETIRQIQNDPDVKIVENHDVKTFIGEIAKFKTKDDETGEVNIKITSRMIGNDILDHKIEVVRRRVYPASKDIIRDRSSKVNIRLKDGLTFVIGGVTPGDVGIYSGIKRELYAFITPHIMPSPGDDNFTIKETDNTPHLVSIDFEDADIKSFINFISNLTGKNFIVGPDVKGKINVHAPTKLTVGEVYEVFESTLEVHGFTTMDAGSAIKIIKR